MVKTDQLVHQIQNNNANKKGDLEDYFRMEGHKEIIQNLPLTLVAYRCKLMVEKTSLEGT